MAKHLSYKDMSYEEWGYPDGEVTDRQYTEAITAGALQRIADSLESIERSLKFLDPKHRREVEDRRAWNDAKMRANMFVHKANIPRMRYSTRESLAVTFVCAHGLGADPTDKALWIEAIENDGERRGKLADDFLAWLKDSEAQSAA